MVNIYLLKADSCVKHGTQRVDTCYSGKEAIAQASEWRMSFSAFAYAY